MAAQKRRGAGRWGRQGKAEGGLEPGAAMHGGENHAKIIAIAARQSKAAVKLGSTTATHKLPQPVAVWKERLAFNSGVRDVHRADIHAEQPRPTVASRLMAALV